MDLYSKFFSIILLSLSIHASANDKLLHEGNKIFFKTGGSKIFLFNDSDFCFEENSFFIENLTNDSRKYLFVNYTEDCNLSGEYKIFELYKNSVKKFYLSSLYDPEFLKKEKTILERFKDGVVSYTRVYKMKNNKYYLVEELKTLGDNVQLSTIFFTKSKSYFLKNDAGEKVERVLISVDKSILYNEEFKKTNSYLIEGDVVDIIGVEKFNDDFYLSVKYSGRKGVVNGFIKISDIL
ncbi:hypothetical protein [Acinetobacter courvalinii]|uniref:Uncharacterized protein n=1 Tax=Acinetobacter courvalinii TaxID=280147 RepID=N9R9N3_9GAMM|nr:hypothetical protein [Acinetobacter courvalinii]ENX39031.1 hypothetical protein F888_01902 [Acinetobacter courvalinii]KAB0657983.1 hypothetical protein F7P77_09625 [Acinetobacter courvalinii]RSN83312.1 hypothetical protein EA770_06870 [Acinetobacter baumannii]GGH32646.1 hypothetical protein GCM10007354_14060 [Acinetobacter courvalinii]